MEAKSILEATSRLYKNTGGTTVSSQGASGGIATLWNEKIWSSEVISDTQNWILTVLKNKDNNSFITVINIYMPNTYRDKLATWASLSDLRNSVDLPSCIIGGDLNTHLSPGGKKRRKQSQRPFL
jgi:hypothetical protein